MAEPVLKWAGGKRQLLDELKSRFPSEFGHYHEPLVGGGAVFFELQPKDGTINDTNVRLINFYEQIRDNPDTVISRLKSYKHPEEPPEDDRYFSKTDRKGGEIEQYYYQQRAIFNKRPYDEEFDPVEEAALLLYLNRTCYNGLYRQNNSGGFNVPIGRYSNPDWIQEKRIREASEILSDTEILNRDFEYILDYAEPGDFVYFDPPYEPMSSTAYFTNYSAEGFGKEDQKRLLRAAETLDEDGVKFVLSNSGVMYEKYEEAGFYVEIEEATRAINSDADNRDEVDEIIATNIPPEERVQTGQKEIVDFQ